MAHAILVGTKPVKQARFVAVRWIAGQLVETASATAARPWGDAPRIVVKIPSGPLLFGHDCPTQTLKEKGDLERPPYIYGGDEGVRTLDLSDANAALSQLSYIPKWVHARFSTAMPREHNRGIHTVQLPFITRDLRKRSRV